MSREMELTGPLALYLQASSTATNTDWLVFIATFSLENATAQGARLIRTGDALR